MTGRAGGGPPELPRIPPVFRDGGEPLHADGAALDGTLLDFWRWAGSRLTDNGWRGAFAEFLVAHALGLALERPREERDECDLRRGGLRIEVKSAAYIQSWRQRAYSPISFEIAPKRYGWDARRETHAALDPPRRTADVYVFCLLKHKHQPTLDPLDVTQWAFHVVPECRLPSQDRISLRPLRKLGAALEYGELESAVGRAEAEAGTAG